MFLNNKKCPNNLFGLYFSLYNNEQYGTGLHYSKFAPAYMSTASFLGKNKDGKSHLCFCLTYFITTLRFNLAVP